MSSASTADRPGGRSIDTLIAVTAIEISLVVGLLTVAVTAAAIAGIMWMSRSTRPTPLAPGPATSELGNEPPAVVDLLTGGFRVEHDAVPATVIHLAHRRHFTIEKLGGRTILRLRRHGSDDRPLQPYEERILDHIQRNAVDGVTPAEVLTLGERGVSQRWFSAFAREVTAHARELGLSRPRWTLRELGIVWGLVAAAFAVPALAARSAPRSDSPLAWGSAGNVLTGIAFIAAIGVVWLARNTATLNAQVPTDAGRAAASHWLGVREHYRHLGNFRGKEAASVAIWDDHLAYATAMGLARQVERELPFAAESDTRAWSNVTGEWRKVNVTYLVPRPLWGQPPSRVLVSGLLAAVVGVVVAYYAFAEASGRSTVVPDSLSLEDEWLARVSLIATIVAILAGTWALYGAIKVAVGASDLFRRTTIEGVVLRRRRLARGLDRYAEQVEQRFRLPFRINLRRLLNRDRSPHLANRGYRWFIAIDDGSQDRIRALSVNESTFEKIAQGATVRVTYSPLLGHVRNVTTLSAPASQPADPSLAEEVVGRMTGMLGARLADGISKMSEALDPDQMDELASSLGPDELRRMEQVLGADHVDRIRQALGQNDHDDLPPPEPPAA